MGLHPMVIVSWACIGIKGYRFSAMIFFKNWKHYKRSLKAVYDLVISVLLCDICC